MWCLIRIFTERILESQACKVSSFGARRLWSDCADVQPDLILRWAHMLEGTFFTLRLHYWIVLYFQGLLDTRHELSCVFMCLVWLLIITVAIKKPYQACVIWDSTGKKKPNEYGVRVCLVVKRSRVRSPPSGDIRPWRLVMTYFQLSFSSFRWFKKGSCQFLTKECAQELVNRLEERTKPAKERRG